MYDVHRLRLLRELSLRGTLAAVADALGYSPSAVSHQLAVLEREVGVELLEPLGRGVRLTAAAGVLVTHTEAILRELELAEASVAASRADVSGTVRIATFQTVARTIVPAALGTLGVAHPRLDVTFSHVSAEAAIPGLIAREFDVVLSERYPGEPPQVASGVVTDVLLADALLLATPVAWKIGGLADLRSRPWVMEHEGTSARAWTAGVCRASGFEPRVTFQSADAYLHSDLVAGGLAAGFVPQIAAPLDERIQVTPSGQERLIELSLRAGSANAPAVAAVRGALLAATATLPARSGFRAEVPAGPAPAA